MTVTMTLGQLAEALGAQLKGPAALQITGLATLQEATAGQLSFLANKQYRKYRTIPRQARCCSRPRTPKASPATH